MDRLVEDLQRVLFDKQEKGDVDTKAVVFSQHKAVLSHASTALRDAGLSRHVSICPGDSSELMRQSVATFQ